MVSQVISAGKIYEPTCINLPAAMKRQAKDAGINMAATLRNALKAELESQGITVEEEAEAP